MNAEQLAGAARYLDSIADTQGLLNVSEIVGVPIEDLMYVARQRALRIIMYKQNPGVIPQAMASVTLSHGEHATEKLMSAAIMDGIYIGLAAAQGLTSPLHNPRQPSDN